MLINLSNHPSNTWSEFQVQTAHDQYGEILDLPFPEIDPEWDQMQIGELAAQYLEKVKTLASEHNANAAVHLMGEYSFCFQLVNLLKADGIEAVVSTSERLTEMNPDGSKTIQFNFVRFRKY